MTYADLLALVGSYLHRNDAGSYIPSWVEMAEARFNRVLRTPYQEETAYNDMDGEYISVPSNMLAVRAMVRDTDGRLMSPLRPVDYRNLIDDDPHENRSPNAVDIVPAWCTEDMQFRVYPHPSVSDTLRVRILFYAKIPALGVSAQTNWLIQSHPDVYLSQTLLNGLGFIRATPQEIAEWKSIVEENLTSLGRQRLERIDAQTLRTELGVRGAFNINSGEF